MHKTLEEGRQNQKASIVGKAAANQKMGQLQRTAMGEAQAADGIHIQRLLNQLGAGGEQSPQLNISRVSGAGAPRTRGSTASPGAAKKESGGPPSMDKNEGFYITNNPIEVASICVKLQVETLMQLGAFQSVADVPNEMSQLLQHCNMLSNPEIEGEISGRFFGSTKEMIMGAIENIRQNYRPAVGAADVQGQAPM